MCAKKHISDFWVCLLEYECHMLESTLSQGACMHVLSPVDMMGDPQLPEIDVETCVVVQVCGNTWSTMHVHGCACKSYFSCSALSLLCMCARIFFCLVLFQNVARGPHLFLNLN